MKSIGSESMLLPLMEREIRRAHHNDFRLKSPHELEPGRWRRLSTHRISGERTAGPSESICFRGAGRAGRPGRDSGPDLGPPGPQTAVEAQPLRFWRSVPAITDWAITDWAPVDGPQPRAVRAAGPASTPGGSASGGPGRAAAADYRVLLPDGPMIGPSRPSLIRPWPIGPSLIGPSLNRVIADWVINDAIADGDRY
jgi:hypothetical protein